ncbi:hypothetical protein GCM10010168_16540 [Actinoplanes ianthinogenes]|uniref:Uncharacterized protein n=1 Tax=Actinoplanes ianthinogenes TaxID=122358 RepID=A0ABN6CIV7_9ACTN|nr:hypothetical protein [Actinoplanes ianthinogenes]BCJ44841.1 hypothetical protein Aiant_54980 [Actinoplanes ianthinogenes]GGR00313.1 hypothetical protein GCM10010168_16540 [Actinoplanes ianthinogenes]
MATRSAGTRRPTSGLALLLFGLPAVVEPLVVGVAATGFDEIADASPFGAQGTFAIGVVAAVFSAIGTVMAWRGVDGLIRLIMAILLAIFAGLIAAMALALLFAGGVTLIFAVLLLHAAFSIVMITQALLRSKPSSEGR